MPNQKHEKKSGATTGQGKSPFSRAKVTYSLKGEVKRTEPRKLRRSDYRIERQIFPRSIS